MQTLNQGQGLAYPIEFYLSQKTIAVILALGLLLLPLGFYAVPWAQQGSQWVALLFIWLAIGIILLSLTTLTLTLIKREPLLRISDQGLDILQVLQTPQQKHVPWKEIAHLDIVHRAMKFNEVWVLVLHPKAGYGKVIQYPIKPMRCQGRLYREQEIAQMLEQAFDGHSDTQHKPTATEHTTSTVSLSKPQ